MKVINLYGAPGTGKSTSAAYIFSYLKNRGCNVELISEYAKQLVYSRRQAELGNQVYVLGKQYKKMKDIEDYGKVNLVITDSPILLGLLYSEHLSYFNELKELTMKLYNEFENINVQLVRTKPYNPSGRMQTEEESDAIARRVEDLIGSVGYQYTANGDEEGQQELAEKLFTRFKHEIS